MKEIVPYSISAPGFYGLNLQDSALDMNTGFAYEATNCIIDKFGRIGSRKGWSKAASTSIGGNIAAIGELIGNDGVKYIICAGANKIYKLSSGTLVQLTYGGGGVAPTISASNWQMAALNNHLVLFQTGHDPLIFDPATSSTTYRRITEHASAGGTPPSANCVISAYGRIWVANTASDKNTVTWSNVLEPFKWTGVGYGSLNVAKVWSNGADEITAIAAHNGNLIIFGTSQILVYSGAQSPTDLTLATLTDTINSVGCIARDSVQNIGTDLIFLSNTGVRSLQRTIQEKSAPLRDISKNVRDKLISDITNETLANIKSVYSDVNAFYLLSLPVTGEIYCFDMKMPLQDGSARVTKWDSILPKSLFQSSDRVLYFGMIDFLGKYDTYLDNTSTYTMTYFTPHIAFEQGAASTILKKLSIVVIGGSGQRVVFKYATDYSTNYQIGYVNISTQDIAEYGIAEYGLAEYTDGITLDTAKFNAGGHGRVFQIGFEAIVNSYQLSFQKLDVHAKQGKLL